MTRRAWMPDPTLSAWVGFLGKSLTLLVLVGSALLYTSIAIMGLRGLPQEVAAQGVTLNKLAVSDSTGNEEFRKFKNEEFPAFASEMRCLFQMIGNGETPGYNACVSENSGSDES